MWWMMDASGLIGRNPMEAAWWSVLRALGQASHMALAGAYLVVIAQFLRLWGSVREDRTPPRSFRQISAILCFCALAHAGDAVASFLSRQQLMTLPSVLAAVFALVAAFKLTGLTRKSRTKEPVPFQSMVLRVMGPSEPSTSTSTSVTSVGAANGVSAGLREEWARLRIARMEELARRNAWLLKSQEAIERLGSMLNEPLQTCSPGPRPSVPGQAPLGETTEVDGESRRA